MKTLKEIFEEQNDITGEYCEESETVDIHINGKLQCCYEAPEGAELVIDEFKHWMFLGYAAAVEQMSGWIVAPTEAHFILGERYLVKPKSGPMQCNFWNAHGFLDFLLEDVEAVIPVDKLLCPGEGHE